MGKVLDGFDFTTNRAGRGPSYNWDEIFDGQARLLTQGDKEQGADFDYGRDSEGPTEDRAKSFVSGMRTAFAKAQKAKKIPEDMQLKAAIVDENGGVTGERHHVVVQVVKRTAPKRGRKPATDAATPAEGEKAGKTTK